MCLYLVKEVKSVRYIEEYCENYLEKIFYFCLRKTGNESEAEDLAGDIRPPLSSFIFILFSYFSRLSWVYAVLQ